MSFLPRILRRFSHHAPLKPRVFPSTGVPRLVDQHLKFEEETVPGYLATKYYPVRIGEVFADRYQVVGKLGFGRHSTVWLARDLNQHGHVALKIFLHSEALRSNPSNEIAMYERMAQRTLLHLGRTAVRTPLDSFRITGPDGEHLCFVHLPLGESVAAAVRRGMLHMLTTCGLRYVLMHLFMALEYLHKECQIIHTDITADHVMLGIMDPSILTNLEEKEICDPCLRKEVDGRTIYASRSIRSGEEFGTPVLCHFGSAVFGDQENLGSVQPHIYKSPEVILGASWDYKIDIWNVGCMIFDIYEQRCLFEGIDPEHREYRSRAHLAEIIALLGPPPKDLLARGSLTSKFFSPEGRFIGGIELPAPTSLEAAAIINLIGEEKRRFLDLVRKMLNWDPAQRSTAGELYRDPWLKDKSQ